jgi:hypothetical protein
MFSYQPEKLETAYPIIKETIPASSLGYNTNNKYPEFPPLMSDGRAVFGSWQPESILNADLLESNNIKSNWQYRRYLTKNSKEIMEYNFRESCNDAGYFKRPIDLPSMQSNSVTGFTNSPYLYKSVLDNTNVLGHDNSDLKNLYLTREQLNSRKISPVVTQEEFITRK